MKKKKQNIQAKKEDKPVTLGDMLNADLLKQLKDQKQQLKEAEEKSSLKKRREKEKSAGCEKK